MGDGKRGFVYHLPQFVEPPPIHGVAWHRVPRQVSPLLVPP